MAKKILTLSIGEELENISVEQLLKQEFHLSKREISRTKFQEKGICLNGEKVRVNQRAKKGDCLTVSFEEEKSSNVLLPKEGKFLENLSILYEDEDMLIVNKPPMMPTQPTGRHAAHSLCNLVYAHALKYEKNPLIRPVGRLDMETSGVVVFAKNQIAASRLSSQREDGTFEKIYYAFVAGEMEQSKGIICEPIGAAGGGNGRNRIKMQVCADGKTAVTRYEVVKSYGEMSLVCLWLRTGRTHQIRVHMGWLGHALLGDQLYAEKEQASFGFSRAALHAGRVKLRHPFTRETLCVSAPFPEDFCDTDREIKRLEINNNF